MFKEKVRRKKR